MTEMKTDATEKECVIDRGVYCTKSPPFCTNFDDINEYMTNNNIFYHDDNITISTSIY